MPRLSARLRRCDEAFLFAKAGSMLTRRNAAVAVAAACLHSRMFHGAGSFNSDVSGWNTENVREMTNMFTKAADFNADLSNWNTGKVTNMNNMFHDATKFFHDLRGWDVTNAQDTNKQAFNDHKHVSMLECYEPGSGCSNADVMKEWFGLWKANRDIVERDLGKIEDWDMTGVKSLE